MSNLEVECIDCGSMFTGPEDVSPHSNFICATCASTRVGPASGAGPQGYHKMTVHSEAGVEVVYVPALDDLLEAEATEEESELASDAVRDIGEILEVDLDEYGDLLQEVVEDVILSVRESVLHVAKLTLTPEAYEKFAKIIRE